MSRGLGRVQQEILAAFRERSGPRFRNEVLWDLAAREERRLEDAPSGRRVRHAFYVTFINAWNGLSVGKEDASPGLIRTEKRQLRSVKEVIAHYPHKSLDAPVRAMRIELLPHLFEIARQRRVVFSSGELETLASTGTRWHREPVTVRDIEAWAQLEATLLELAARDPGPRRWCVEMLAKGASFFAAHSNVSAGRRIDVLLREIPDAIPASTRGDLLDLWSRTVPTVRLRRWTLKDRIYRVAEFNGHGSATLKRDVERELLSVRPDIVRGLAGHRDAVRQGAFVEEDVRFSPCLGRLIDRHALEPFVFGEAV